MRALICQVLVTAYVAASVSAHYVPSNQHAPSISTVTIYKCPGKTSELKTVASPTQRPNHGQPGGHHDHTNPVRPSPPPQKHPNKPTHPKPKPTSVKYPGKTSSRAQNSHYSVTSTPSQPVATSKRTSSSKPAVTLSTSERPSSSRSASSTPTPTGTCKYLQHSASGATCGTTYGGVNRRDLFAPGIDKPETCANLCKDIPACNAFALSKDLSIWLGCYLFFESAATLVAGQNTTDIYNGGWQVWDRSCLCESAPPSPQSCALAAASIGAASCNRSASIYVGDGQGVYGLDRDGCAELCNAMGPSCQSFATYPDDSCYVFPVPGQQIPPSSPGDLYYRINLSIYDRACLTCRNVDPATKTTTRTTTVSATPMPTADARCTLNAPAPAGANYTCKGTVKDNLGSFRTSKNPADATSDLLCAEQCAREPISDCKLSGVGKSHEGLPTCYLSSVAYSGLPVDFDEGLNITVYDRECLACTS